MLFMLVESRGPFDDDGDEDRTRREPWLASLLDWLFPWPAVIVWLCVASRLLDGWVAVGCIFAAIWLCVWRGLKALPSDGLNEARQ